MKFRNFTPKIRQSLFVFLLVFALCGATPVSRVHASGDYKPNDAEMPLDAGLAKSVGILLLNLTPYPMEFYGPDMGKSTNYDTDRSKKKSFAFAPIGLPDHIPALGPNTHPYPMVIAFNDHGGFVSSYSPQWKLKGVSEKGATPSDVLFSININRIQDDPNDAKGGLYESIGEFVMDIIKVVVEPESPFVWIEIFNQELEALAEASGFTGENTNNMPGDKMYVSSYPVDPRGTTPATYPAPAQFSGQSNTVANDAIITQWGTLSSDNVASIIGITQVLRTEDSPRMIVAVMTADQYLAAIPANVAVSASVSKSAYALHQLVKERGIHGKRQLYTLTKTMTREQGKTFLAAYGNIKKGKRPTAEEEALLGRVVIALSKNAKTL